MGQRVNGPDGNIYNFPDGTTKDQAIAYFRKKGIGVVAPTDSNGLANQALAAQGLSVSPQAQPQMQQVTTPQSLMDAAGTGLKQGSIAAMKLPMQAVSEVSDVLNGKNQQNISQGRLPGIVARSVSPLPPDQGQGLPNRIAEGVGNLAGGALVMEGGRGVANAPAKSPTGKRPTIGQLRAMLPDADRKLAGNVASVASPKLGEFIKTGDWRVFIPERARAAYQLFEKFFPAKEEAAAGTERPMQAPAPQAAELKAQGVAAPKASAATWVKLEPRPDLTFPGVLHGESGILYQLSRHKINELRTIAVQRGIDVAASDKHTTLIHKIMDTVTDAEVQDFAAAAAERARFPRPPRGKKKAIPQAEKPAAGSSASSSEDLTEILQQSVKAAKAAKANR